MKITKNIPQKWLEINGPGGDAWLRRYNAQSKGKCEPKNVLFAIHVTVKNLIIVQAAIY